MTHSFHCLCHWVFPFGCSHAALIKTHCYWFSLDIQRWILHLYLLTCKHQCGGWDLLWARSRCFITAWRCTANSLVGIMLQSLVIFSTKWDIYITLHTNCVNIFTHLGPRSQKICTTKKEEKRKTLKEKSWNCDIILNPETTFRFIASVLSAGRCTN